MSTATDKEKREFYWTSTEKNLLESHMAQKY